MRDVLTIRAVDGLLSGANSECDRKFSVMADVSEERVIYVNAYKK